MLIQACVVANLKQSCDTGVQKGLIVNEQKIKQSCDREDIEAITTQFSLITWF